MVSNKPIPKMTDTEIIKLLAEYKDRASDYTFSSTDAQYYCGLMREAKKRSIGGF